MPFAVGAAAAVLVLAGCSGDGDGGSGEGGGDGRSGGESASPTVATDAQVGKVRGTLKNGPAEQALAEVTAVVDAWIDAAFGGDYPRTDFTAAFAAFTKDARALAEKQAGVLTNADLGGELAAVEITERKVRVDLVGTGRKPAGATARVDVGLDLGDAGADRVTGRLLLSPSADGWQVFGFDVQRGQEGA